jgi:hypothetical protein
MKQILGKCWEQDVHVHRLHFYFQLAYDTVWRKEIWSEMLKLGFPEKLVKLYKI